MKGSATSGVMVRGHRIQLGCSQFPDSVDYENFMTQTPVWTPELPSTCMQTNFLQVKVIFRVTFPQVAFCLSVLNFVNPYRKGVQG